MTREIRTICSVLILLAVVSILDVSYADEVFSPAAQRGLTLVRTNCAGCHAVDKYSESTLKIAPPFRTLHDKYPIESLRLPLREGVLTSHPTMPVFRLDLGQVEDIIAYLKTLEG